MDPLEFTYYLKWDNSEHQTYRLELDPETIAIRHPAPEKVPNWARLDCNQCPNCSLDSGQSNYCPLAYHLVEACNLFSEFSSHDELDLVVDTNERRIIKRTTAQRAISSLLGLIIPASGCPHTALFLPMARFHLPLASEDETIFRATGMYLIAQYFLNNDNQDIDLTLEGLSRVYQQLHTVNQYIAKRLREAFSHDSTVNAVILLDIFAKTMPYAIEDSLRDIQHLFQPYLGKANNINP